MMERQTMRYAACGLDNVVIEGAAPMIDDNGDEVLMVPHVARLHKVIAEDIINAETSLTGKELRFLRTEAGWTQAELARSIQREALTVSRWERGECPIDLTTDFTLRVLFMEKLSLRFDGEMTDVIEHIVSRVDGHLIRIDGSDPTDPQRIAA